MATKEELQARFGLRDHQMRSDNNGRPFTKNQWWYLNEVEVGYGDLSQDDVIRISETLEDDETFVTFNEYDGHTAFEAYVSPFEFGHRPRLVISSKDIQFPQENNSLV